MAEDRRDLRAERVLGASPGPLHLRARLPAGRHRATGGGTQVRPRAGSVRCRRVRCPYESGAESPPWSAHGHQEADRWQHARRRRDEGGLERHPSTSSTQDAAAGRDHPGRDEPAQRRAPEQRAGHRDCAADAQEGLPPRRSPRRRAGGCPPSGTVSGSSSSRIGPGRWGCLPTRSEKVNLELAGIRTRRAVASSHQGGRSRKGPQPSLGAGGEETPGRPIERRMR